jgi:hypothetical protein
MAVDPAAIGRTSCSSESPIRQFERAQRAARGGLLVEPFGARTHAP